MRIINVMAASLDGKIASHPGETDHARRALGFTNDDDRQHLHDLLITADAVVVGSSSLMASGGAWELPGPSGKYPIWAVLTNKGLPADARFFRQERLRRWLVSRSPLAMPPAAAGVRNVVYGERPAARAIFDELKAAGAKRVLLFGGGFVNREFYAENLVDELILTICPLIIGGSHAVPLIDPSLNKAVKLSLVSSQAKGNLVFLTYTVQKH